MSVSHYTNTGRFNLLSSELSQQVVLLTPAGNVSCVWPEDEAPYESDMLPTEVSQILRDRIKQYLLISDREKKLAVLDAIDARGNEFDCEFLLGMSKQFAEKASKYAERSRRYRDQANEVES